MRGDLRDVIEIKADNERGDSTYRAAYTIKLGDTVYVLHAFQKKSKKGRKAESSEHLKRVAREIAEEYGERVFKAGEERPRGYFTPNHYWDWPPRRKPARVTVAIDKAAAKHLARLAKDRTKAEVIRDALALALEEFFQEARAAGAILVVKTPERAERTIGRD